jgi:hypothetical protein
MQALAHCCASAAMLLALAGCAPANDAADGAAAGTASAIAARTTDTVPAQAANEPASPGADDDPCRLLTMAEIGAEIPGVQPGARDRSREQYGIRACIWKTPRGLFSLQLWSADPGTLDDEIRGMSLGVLDPTIATDGVLRFEKIEGIADAAEAIVEKQDGRRGILTDVATLMAQRGDRILELQSTDLAKADRDAALRALTALAKTAAARETLLNQGSGT